MNTIKKITILGDIHQKYDQLEKLNLHNDYVVQLGDLGFSYKYIYDNYDPDKFKVCLGNHDQYDDRPTGYDLGDFGLTTLNGMEFFYVRGEWSIDIKQRQRLMANGYQRIWWPDEQLSRSEMEECLELYKKTKPDVVMSHTCPSSISDKIGNPGVWKFFGWDEPQISLTQDLLEAMYVEHEPKLWLFGHFHRPWIHQDGDTTFICIDELSFMDFNDQWEIV